MTERELLSEELLEGWLEVSLSIINERLVSAMTFNESMVCNLLYRQGKKGGAPLTATDLCARLRILKPQMNVILNHLENGGLISRIRSRVDKRNVHISLTDQGTQLYEKAHKEILRLPDGLIERLGEEKIRQLVQMLKEVTVCFGQMMKEEEEARANERFPKSGQEEISGETDGSKETDQTGKAGENVSKTSGGKTGDMAETGKNRGKGKKDGRRKQE